MPRPWSNLHPRIDKSLRPPESGGSGTSENAQRDISESISACMRSLYASDQWAPGFRLALLSGCGGGGGSVFAAGLRAPAFSLRVRRGEGESETGFD